LKAAFDALDVDFNGYLTLDQLEQFLGYNPEKEWAHILDRYDENRDGRIDLKEFVNLMVSTH
jgi:Ca2+-binding EF-hand superfamily protein